MKSPEMVVVRSNETASSTCCLGYKWQHLPSEQCAFFASRSSTLSLIAWDPLTSRRFRLRGSRRRPTWRSHARMIFTTGSGAAKAAIAIAFTRQDSRQALPSLPVPLGSGHLANANRQRILLSLIISHRNEPVLQNVWVCKRDREGEREDIAG